MMNLKTVLLVIPVLVCSWMSLPAQKSVEVSDPDLSLVDGKVKIGYRLLHTDDSQRFTVRIEVTGQGGNRIPARTLTGDIGSGISGKGEKTILWDIEADSVFLDEEIFVEVYARLENPAPEEIAAGPREEEAAGPREEEVAGQEKTGKEGSGLPEQTEGQKELNRTVLILESMVFPGLGLSRLHPGQPHWLRGVAAYGCLAGSVYYNRKAWNTYQQYLDPSGIDQVGDLFDKAYDMKKTSRLLSYGAIGVWVVDIAWTLIGTSGMTGKGGTESKGGFGVGSSADPVTGIPLLALRYRF